MPDRRWRIAAAMVVLAAPFVVAGILLNGLQTEIRTFHGSDERVYHYPVILRFIETFPRMQVWDYDSATTPLFHVVFATIGKLVSPALPSLRAVNASLSYASAVLLFLIFSRIYRVDTITAVLIALALILSPYVFGISFLLLTDSMALLFVIAALFALMLHMERGEWPYLACAALLASCAVLTRQSNIWLFPLILAVSALRPQQYRRSTALGTFILLALAAAPLVVLFVAWGGPNPPKWRVHSALNPGAITFFTACIGAYGAPLALAALWSGRNLSRPTAGRALAIMLIGTALLLWLGPLQYVAAQEHNIAQSVFPSDGFLWRVSRLFPAVGGTSLLFWVLVPLGLLVLLNAWERDGIRSLPLLIYLFSALTSVSNAATYQKYFDYIALLIVFVTVFCHPGYRLIPARAVLALYCCGFVAYAVGNPFAAPRTA
jgi:hypothetical protein